MAEILERSKDGWGVLALGTFSELFVDISDISDATRFNSTDVPVELEKVDVSLSGSFC